MLLAAGAEIEAKDEIGPGPSSQVGSLAVGTAPLGRGNTPLHWAAIEGRTEAAKALLEANASVAGTDGDGRGGLGARFADSWPHQGCSLFLFNHILL